MTAGIPRLALGPVPYFWPRDILLEFYAGIAATPVDIVYLGETVCAKRRSLNAGDWLALARRLREAGKTVVLSTLTLLEAGSELGALRRLCEQDEFPVEANDMAAVHHLAGRPFVTGPAVNIYNARTLAVLAGLGLRRWVLPLELSRATLAGLQAGRPAGVETEVFVYGRLPLAWSARCFTARAHDLGKDACGFRCLNDPDGLLMSTREAEPFLVLNGIQTQSARTLNLIGELDDLRALQVDVLRISPQFSGTARVIAAFHDCLRGSRDPAEARAALAARMPVGPCDGYWHGGAGMQVHRPAGPGGTA